MFIHEFYIYSSENMEEYLVSVNNSLEFTENLVKIKDDCNLEFNGSKLHKFIHLLVEMILKIKQFIYLSHFSVWLQTILMRQALL